LRVSGVFQADVLTGHPCSNKMVQDHEQTAPSLLERSSLERR